MRVSTFMTQESRLSEIMQSESQVEITTNELATGLKVTKPSDAPGDIAEILDVQSSIASATTRVSGISATTPISQASDTALGQISNALEQVKTLALQAANATSSPAGLGGLADQVQALIGQIQSLANTQSEGTYVFGGTQTKQQPFTAGPPVTYAGNSSPIQVSLGNNQQFGVSITGDRLLNARSGTDLFQNLSALEQAMRSGDTAGMQTGMTGVDADFTNVTSLQADLGSREQYVQLAKSQLTSAINSAQQRQSQLEDVDLATAVVDQKTAQTAEQAILQVTGQMGTPSLLDYLR